MKLVCQEEINKCGQAVEHHGSQIRLTGRRVIMPRAWLSPMHSLCAKAPRETDRSTIEGCLA